MASGRSRTTMAQIADQAGVAVSTVSKVLNGHSDVSATTRASIEALLAESGYQRPRSVRRTGRRGDLIELVINEMDSFWGLSILTGVERVTEESGIGVVVSAMHNRESLTTRWLDTLLARGSRGAILVLSELTDAQRERLTRRGFPFVVVDPVSELPPEIPSIGATNFAGGVAATEHLLKLGHQRIAVIGGPEQLQCTRARVAGYRAAMESAGLIVDRQLVRYGDFHHEGGLRATRALLALDHPPTAIFAGSDQHAMGAFEAANLAGLTIPDDLSVVGYDDLSYARMTSPPLTTIRQPLREMGMIAARTLLRTINGERLEATRIELATELVVRESTARLRRFG